MFDNFGELWWNGWMLSYLYGTTPVEQNLIVSSKVTYPLTLYPNNSISRKLSQIYTDKNLPNFLVIEKHCTQPKCPSVGA